MSRINLIICLIFAAFPSDPEIEMSGPLVSGNPVTVSCKVPNVYPLDWLEIELFKGESTMMNKIFSKDVSKKALETKSLEKTFIPTTEDTGNALVCLARLSTDEMEFEPKQRQSTQTLYVNGKYMCDVFTIDYDFFYHVCQVIVSMRFIVETIVKK